MSGYQPAHVFAVFSLGLPPNLKSTFYLQERHIPIHHIESRKSEKNLQNGEVMTNGRNKSESGKLVDLLIQFDATDDVAHSIQRVLSQNNDTGKHS